MIRNHNFFCIFLAALNGSLLVSYGNFCLQNLLVHVRDLTNPDYELQKKSVLEVLANLKVDETLLHNMIEVHNKSDLR